MTIIVDTNVMLAALIKKGIVRQLITDNAGEFITPGWCYKELIEHEYVWNRNNLNKREVNSILKELKQNFILPIEKKYYSKKLEEAGELITDPDDVPIVAVALAIENEGVWTFNTKHFDTKKIKKSITILNTNDVKLMFEDSNRSNITEE